MLDLHEATILQETKYQCALNRKKGHGTKLKRLTK